jgi:hypothetical protein
MAGMSLHVRAMYIRSLSGGDDVNPCSHMEDPRATVPTSSQVRTASPSIQSILRQAPLHDMASRVSRR